MRRLAIISVFSLTCFLSFVSLAQRLGIDEGLSHTWAKAITKDQKGNIWVGTLDGLNKYNGTEVTIYRNVRNESNSLSDNFIQALASDQHDNIWIGTISAGLNKYNSRTDEFIRYRTSPKLAGTIVSDNVTSLFIDSQDRLWVGTDKGICLFKEEDNSFNRNPFDWEDQTVRGRVIDIYEDHNNQLWIATDDGLYAAQIENKKFTLFNSDNSEIPDQPVGAVYEDERNTVWVGLLGGGLLSRSAANEFRKYDEQSGTLGHNNVLAITGDRQGRVYVGTEGGGLHIFDVATGESVTTNATRSLLTTSVHELYYDELTKIVWLGSYHSGVYFFSQWEKEIVHLQAPVLKNNNVLSFAEDNKNTLYVGTDGAGINALHQNGDVEIWDTKNTNLPSNVILSMMIEEDGTEWFGTFQGGLALRKASDQPFTIYTHSAGDEGSLSQNDVSAIHRDHKGVLWVGTMQGGLNRYDYETGKFQTFKAIVGDPNSISGNFVSHIEDFDDDYLVVVTAVGVDLLDKVSLAFTSLSKKHGVPISSPVCYHKDSRDNIWIGGREELLCLMPDGSSKRFTIDDGLPTNYIASIEEDDAGNLWISTQRGLVKAIGAAERPEKPEFHVFTKQDGLQGLDFRPRSSYSASNGKLYFGGNNGLNYFHPDDIWLNPVKPTITFTDFKLFNESVDFRASEILSQPIDYAQQVTLDHTQNMFEVQFSSSNFLLPEKNNFAYMLEGFDEGWKQVGNMHFASYTNVPPGDYKLMVKSANNDGIWNEEPAVLSISIIPPWWQAPWFQWGSVLTLVLLVFGLFRVRGIQYRQRQQKLQEEIKLATEKITEVNRLLETQNEDLLDKNQLLKDQNLALEQQSEKINQLIEEIQESNEGKIRFFTNISHELRTPLTLIISPLKELIKQSNAGNHATYELMYENAIRLLKTVNQLLDFRKLETGNTALAVDKLELVEYTKSIFNSFQFLASKRNIRYELTSNVDSCMGWIDHEKVEKILLNLLSNAFKFTKSGGSIHMEINAAEGKLLSVTISDTGQGIAQEHLDKIFDIYYQGDQISEVAGTGIGLALIKQYVELHHATIEVKSQLGRGTSFIINLPIDEQAYTDAEKKEHPSSVKVSGPEGQGDHTADRESGHSIAAPTGKFRLLIVEDNDGIRSYMKNALSRDFEIIEANNGEIGLQIVLEEAPDFVISDVMMPVMTGTELCRKIKGNPETAHIPVTLLTAYSGEENTRDGFSSGADDYIVKPFDIDLLRQKMLNKAETRSTLLRRFKKHTSLDPDSIHSLVDDADFMDSAIAIVHSHLSNNLFGVEEFSERLGLSRRSLLRKTKASTGLSVNEFIRNIRLKKAAEMLSQGNKNISEVAYATGFTDPKYFSKCFKNDFDITPTEYMEQYSTSE